MPCLIEYPLSSALIVDDHPLFCDARAMTLKAVVGIARFETADRLDAAIARLDAGLMPDVVVLDLNLPDVNGLDGLIHLRQILDRVPVVVVASLADNWVTGACLQAGAAGFVPKHARLALLARQQSRILQLICEGKLNKQIAFDPTIAETTVKAHVTAIMRKLGVQSRIQVVFFSALDEGLVLTLAEPQDMVAHLDAELTALQNHGQPVAILAYDCILRRMEASEKQMYGAASEVLRKHQVTGFSTYGAQWESMHVNQTMKSIAIYPPDLAVLDD